MLRRITARSINCAQTYQQFRCYARSRFSDNDSIGFGRAQRARAQSLRGGVRERPGKERQPSADESPLWKESTRSPASDPEEGLQRLLSEDVLVVTRQLEMLNVFAGFEQGNKYAITSIEGEPLGFIAEESQSILSMFSRQAFRTHRPFRAVIMDQDGTPVLWLRRPFSWLTSRMFVQCLKNFREYSSDGQPVLDTFGEVQQLWHLWRRRYDLFLKQAPHRILTLADDPQPELEPEILEDEFVQLARIDQGFLSWEFILRNENDEPFALVDKKFRGLGREIFTDTSRYFVHFDLPNLHRPTPVSVVDTEARKLSLEQRALILATAVNIDFDYFSQHSGRSGWALPLLIFAGVQ